MRFSKAVVKCRIPILLVTILLMVPALFGMLKTRINYDMLVYLPKDMDTITGQNLLLEDFGKGGISILVMEDMTPDQVSSMVDEMKQVPHVESVISYDSLTEGAIPRAFLPEKYYKEFNAETPPWWPSSSTPPPPPT